jgi:hypothetical protein
MVIVAKFSVNVCIVFVRNNSEMTNDLFTNKLINRLNMLENTKDPKDPKDPKEKGYQHDDVVLPQFDFIAGQASYFLQTDSDRIKEMEERLSYTKRMLANDMEKITNNEEKINAILTNLLLEDPEEVEKIKETLTDPEAKETLDNAIKIATEANLNEKILDLKTKMLKGDAEIEAKEKAINAMFNDLLLTDPEAAKEIKKTLGEKGAVNILDNNIQNIQEVPEQTNWLSQKDLDKIAKIETQLANSPDVQQQDAEELQPDSQQQDVKEEGLVDVQQQDAEELLQQHNNVEDSGVHLHEQL